MRAVDSPGQVNHVYMKWNPGWSVPSPATSVMEPGSHLMIKLVLTLGNSCANLKLVSQRPVLNMLNICLLIQSCNKCPPTIVVGCLQIGHMGMGLRLLI